MNGALRLAGPTGTNVVTSDLEVDHFSGTVQGRKIGDGGDVERASSRRDETR